MSYHLNTRIPDDIDAAILRIKDEEHRGTYTATLTALLYEALEARAKKNRKGPAAPAKTPAKKLNDNPAE